MIETQPPKLTFKIFSLFDPVVKFDSVEDMINNYSFQNKTVGTRFLPYCQVCRKPVNYHELNKKCYEQHYYWAPEEGRYNTYTVEHKNHAAITCNVIVRDNFGHCYTGNDIYKLYPKRVKQRRSWEQWSADYNFGLRHIKRRTHVSHYHRHPKTLNEMRQYAASQVDHPVKVRPARHDCNLPDTWDDLKISMYDYKGWKNIKVRKQWMVAL